MEERAQRSSIIGEMADGQRGPHKKDRLHHGDARSRSC